MQQVQLQTCTPTAITLWEQDLTPQYDTLCLTYTNTSTTAVTEDLRLQQRISDGCYNRRKRGSASRAELCEIGYMHLMLCGCAGEKVFAMQKYATKKQVLGQVLDCVK